MQILKKATRAVARKTTKLSAKLITDQSYKKACDINHIVKTYSKTGILPNTNKIPKFGDYSDMPTLEEAFEVAHIAQEAFYGLPSTIRKLLDNDPSKLEEFIQNKENFDLCVKFGLLEKKEEPVPTPRIHTPSSTDVQPKTEVKKTDEALPNS